MICGEKTSSDTRIKSYYKDSNSGWPTVWPCQSKEGFESSNENGLGWGKKLLKVGKKLFKVGKKLLRKKKWKRIEK